MAFRRLFQRSKQEPPSPKLLPADWRKKPSTGKEAYLKHFNDFQLDQTNVQHIRILLFGPIDAGKSSFINSVETTLRGRITGTALAGVDDESFTTKFQTHRVHGRKAGSFYPFVFNDVMGLEDHKNRGLCVDDIKLVLKGHMTDGYVFNPLSPFSSESQHYNHSPSLSDQTHVLVFVISACTFKLMSESVLEKMREARHAARDLGIPQILVLTKVDEACPEVHSNLNNVYRSKFLKTQVETLSKSLGIPLNCMFPVKNYHKEICNDDAMDLLILTALNQMVDFGEDFINEKSVAQP